MYIKIYENFLNEILPWCNPSPNFLSFRAFLSPRFFFIALGDLGHGVRAEPYTLENVITLDQKKFGCHMTVRTYVGSQYLEK